jgi:hypothetical protein
MHLLLLFIPFIVLFPFPILYPPVASLTAYFFAKDTRLDAVSLFLLYSSGIVTSLIAATITPVSDTAVYIDSFERINSFDFGTLALDNDGFEPLYKIYELILSVFIGDNPSFFLLTTALIINSLATTAILRIGIRLNQYRLTCLILAICYSLAAPALGVPLFLLRSSLSLAILFLAISFYDEVPILFYLLSTVAIFIHFYSFLIFGILIFHKYLVILGMKIAEPLKRIFYISISETFFSRIFLLIFAIGLLVAAVSPRFTAPYLITFLSNLSSSDAMGSGKAKSFLVGSDENFVDFNNPVFIIQIAITLLCFLKLRTESIVSFKHSQSNITKNRHFLDSLRLIGRVLMTLVVFTGPLNFLPFRLGLFNFMYFPLWLINVPFSSLFKRVKNHSKYIASFALISVLIYSFYWIPKREEGKYIVEVLENKPLQYNLIQVVEYYL